MSLLYAASGGVGPWRSSPSHVSSSPGAGLETALQSGQILPVLVSEKNIRLQIAQVL